MLNREIRMLWQMLSSAFVAVLIGHRFIPARFNVCEQILLPMAGSHPHVPKFFILKPSLVSKPEKKIYMTSCAGSRGTWQDHTTKRDDEHSKTDVGGWNSCWINKQGTEPQ